MNKKGFLEIDEINPAAAGLAILGAVGAFWYTGYLGTGAGIVTKLFTALLTAVVGYIIASRILDG